MEAIPFNGATHLLAAPEGWDESIYGPCATLPVRVAEGCITSLWVFSPEEIAMINAGGALCMTVFGGQPPVSFHIEMPTITASRIDDSKVDAVLDAGPKADAPPEGKVLPFPSKKTDTTP